MLIILEKKIFEKKWIKKNKEHDVIMMGARGDFERQEVLQAFGKCEKSKLKKNTEQKKKYLFYYSEQKKRY